MIQIAFLFALQYFSFTNHSVKIHPGKSDGFNYVTITQSAQIRIECSAGGLGRKINQ